LTIQSKNINIMDISGKLKELEKLKREREAVQKLNQVIGEPNMTISWGDRYVEVTFVEDFSRILKKLHGAMDLVVDETLKEIDDDIRKLLK